MATHNINIELSTQATLEVFRLEGKVIALTKTLDNVYRASISDFPIDGDLDYVVYCTGWDPTPWELKLDVDGNNVTNPSIKGKIHKGVSVKSGTIKI